MPPTPMARNLVLLNASTVVSVGPVSWGVEDVWADSPLAMTFGTDPRPLSAFGGPTTVPRDLWSNIAQAMLQE